MVHKKHNTNIQTILDILQDEVDGNVFSALRKMTRDYTMTWMYKSDKKLFPSTGKNVEKEMKGVYPIKGRQYDIRNIAEGNGVVMIELIESYPDPKTRKVYRTPLVLVLEMKNSKIRRGRHYCDPKISYLHLTKRQAEKGFKGTPSKKILE